MHFSIVGPLVVHLLFHVQATCVPVGGKGRFPGVFVSGLHIRHGHNHETFTEATAAFTAPFSKQSVILSETTTPVIISNSITASGSIAPTLAATPSPSNSSSLTSDQQSALDTHNAARAAVEAPALAWNDTLAAQAQAYATQLALKDAGLLHSQTPGEGENLFWFSTATASPLTDGTRAWVAENSSYHGQPIPNGGDDFVKYGHYTQIIWASTTHFGLGSALTAKGYIFVVARYIPPGNFIGETPSGGRY